MALAVVPNNDLKPHDDFSTTCECEPRVVWQDGEMIIVHSAFDGREAMEEVDEILGSAADKSQNT